MPNPIFLSRDCFAIIIPAGDKIQLPAGTKLSITHRLGGNFTVVSDFGMFRIQGKDADALGEALPEAPTTPIEKDVPPGPPDEEALWQALRGVFDPEIPVNIVDLGLVYSLFIDTVEERYVVLMHMTLTAPGCGMGPSIAEDAKQKLLTVPGVADAAVEIVWDPPWSQEMISEEGKMQLGLI